jgi:hypothetical protein
MLVNVTNYEVEPPYSRQLWRSKFFSVNSWSFKLQVGFGIPC